MAAPRSRSTRRWPLAGGVVVALGTGALVALPRWLAGPIEASASEALGRRLSVGSLDLAWLRGAVTLEDLEIGGPPGADPLPPERARDLPVGGLGVAEGAVELAEAEGGDPGVVIERGVRDAPPREPAG